MKKRKFTFQAVGAGGETIKVMARRCALVGAPQTAQRMLKDVPSAEAVFASEVGGRAVFSAYRQA